MMQVRTNAMLVLALLLMAIVVLPVLDRPGVTIEEGQELWAVRDEVRDHGDTVAFLRTNLESLIHRLPDLNHPPLYTVILDAWITAFGESLFIVRYLSFLCAMLTVAALVALANRWWRVRMAIVAPFLVVFVTFSATPLALFAPLSAITVLLQRRLLRRPSLWRMLLFTIVLALLFYTQGLALWFIAMYFFISGLIDRTNRQMVNSLQIAIILYAPYFMSFRKAIPFGRSLEPIPVLLFLYLILLPFVIGFWQQKRLRRLRYIWMIAGILMMSIGFWTVTDRPDWQSLITTVHAERDLTHPILLVYPPDHPLAYYDQLEDTRLREGITLDIGWRYFSPDELDHLLAKLDDVSTVWLINLENKRTILTRVSSVRPGEQVIASAGNVIIYRFRRE